MRAFIVLAATLAVGSAQLLAPIAAIHGAANQYHAQDELGQYSYGYSGGPSSKVESKTADGVVRGAYSYIDGNGLVQSVNYVADPVNGFRTAATNLPVGPAAPVAAVRAIPAIAPIAAVRTIAPAAVHAIAPSPILARAAVAIGQPTYTAIAAPGTNGAVHTATLPLPPIDTPEVQAARLQHLAAKALSG